MRGWRHSAGLILIALLLGLWRVPVLAQGQPPELETIYKRGFELYQAGKVAEAVPIAEEYISVAAAKYGEQHQFYATGLGYLGVLYGALNRPSEAESITLQTGTVDQGESPNALDGAYYDLESSLSVIPTSATGSMDTPERAAPLFSQIQGGIEDVRKPLPHRGGNLAVTPLNADAAP
jgi:tetratricopeptide (TPR) repeat protein